jgi:ketosteroid isomerase-like protein
LEAIACGEIAQVLAQAVPDVTLDIFAPPEFPWIRHAQGTDAVLAAIRQNFGSVDDQRPEITGVFADGNTVVLFGCESGRFRDTGANYEVEFVERFTFRDERLISIRIIGAHVNAYGTTATRSGT